MNADISRLILGKLNAAKSRAAKDYFPEQDQFWSKEADIPLRIKGFITCKVLHCALNLLRDYPVSREDVYRIARCVLNG